MTPEEMNFFLGELEKNAGFGDAAKFLRSKAQGFGKALSGRNVQEAFDRAHSGVMNIGDELVPGIMKNPLVRKAIKKTPGSEKLFSEQFTEMLRKRQKIPIEIFSQKGQRRDIVRTLEKGRGYVGGAVLKRRLARGGTALGVGAPTVYGVNAFAGDSEKVGAEKSLGDQAKDMAPAVAAATAGSVPILHGLKTQALKVRGDTGQVTKSIKDLQKAIRPGDVILSADPGKGGQWKPLISALGGDPTGYHIESPIGKTRSGFSKVEATPGYGGAYRTRKSGFIPDEDIIIRRYKDKRHAAEYVKNLKARAVAEEAYGGVVGERARGRLYASKQNVRAALRSLLPGPFNKLVRDPSTVSGMASCSSLTGQCSPVPVSPGIKGKDTLPHHVRSSKAFNTVMSYKAPRTRPQAAYNAALRAAPWLLRGTAAAGLGYGAYRGAKALMDR